MKIIHTMFALLLVVALAGCAGLEVSHDYDPEVDFAALKTYDWIPVEKQAGVSELTEKKIMSAVNSQLEAKGLKQDQEAPDFLIGTQVSGRTTYGGSVGIGASIGIPLGPGFISLGSGRSRAEEKHEGSLVLDFINPETRSLLWRGAATSTIDPNATPEEQQDLINRAVSEMLTHFPPQK